MNFECRLVLYHTHDHISSIWYVSPYSLSPMCSSPLFVYCVNHHLVWEEGDEKVHLVVEDGHKALSDSSSHLQQVRKSVAWTTCRTLQGEEKKIIKSQQCDRWKWHYEGPFILWLRHHNLHNRLRNQSQKSVGPGLRGRGRRGNKPEDETDENIDYWQNSTRFPLCISDPF